MALKRRVYQVIGDLDAVDLGVAFSGGLDSSLLAKACIDVGKRATLFTVGFSSYRDIGVSKSVSEALNLPLATELVPLEDLESGLKRVLSVIEFDRFVRLENCTCFSYVFRLAASNGVQTLLSANGLDELFCGYDVYKREFSTDEGEMRGVMRGLVKLAREDKREMDKISDLSDVRYLCPFLSPEFVNYASGIPVRYKIIGGEDTVRKWVLRRAALEMGVPREAAWRPKKAFQYSSGIHKAIRRLARKRGFSRIKAKNLGYRSEMKAYIESLIEG